MALAEQGRLGDLQVDAFAMLCELWADCCDHREAVERDGWTAKTRAGFATSPAARLLRDSRRDFFAAARGFGLDAASSARLPSPDADDDEDPLDEFLC